MASYSPQLNTVPHERKAGNAWEELRDPWGFVAESSHAQEAVRERVLSLTLDSPDRKPAQRPEGKEFREYEDLSTADIFKASLLDVLDVEAKPVRFGTLFEDQLTIVVFIRHFWCPLCQDYIRSVIDNASEEALDHSGVKLVIIGNGSPAMAKAYKGMPSYNVFQCPYPIYVDPTRAVYNALGMTRRTLNSGAESEKCTYVRHGTLGSIGMALKNAFKMPIGKAGNPGQLGGEFLLGPGIRAEYAHRMSTTRSHTSIKRLLQLANVDMSPMPTNLQLFLDVDAEEQWMSTRQKEWDDMLRWKELRRWGMDPDYDFRDLELDGDSGICVTGPSQANLPRIGAWPIHALKLSSGDESWTSESSA
ncbi:hypothetical protein BS47DRAFT_1291551 [Hydnum rufescens UP504]|uniref:Thioredoxin-like protein n=1 Tax=Hydnum rufescens UP504 TaxID=1448309 RepID=A0A9P6B3R2_9AGAM|nr:hypothetical protein BS47DRAFT_1291551 [Hydnum rufescens UP504]